MTKETKSATSKPDDQNQPVKKLFRILKKHLKILNFPYFFN